MSLPNVANIWVRLNLLFGRFNYSRVGILDETHLRFFTLESFKEDREGFGARSYQHKRNANSLAFNPALDQQRTSTKFSSRLNWGITRLRKTLFGYQFILVCQPKA